MKTPMAMMLVAISLLACQSVPKPPLASDGNEADQGEAVRKKTGETFTVLLEANHTTGYSWALDGRENARVVGKVSSEYINDPQLPGMVGYGGTEHWKFRAEGNGTTVLHFIYRRPWETDVKPASERSIKVMVE